jgi:F-type H+-transporting ATPase subunit epsilon
MDLQIITPDTTLYDGKADMVVVPGTDGLIGILDNHAPLVSALTSGSVKVKLDDSEKMFEVSGGVVEVLKNKVIVLAS